MVLLFLFLMPLKSYSQYLSYTETNSSGIEMKLPKGVPSSMMNMMPGVNKPSVTTTQHYISPTLTANIEGDNVYVMDFKNKQKVEIDHASRKYSKMSFKQAAKDFYKHAKKNSSGTIMGKDVSFNQDIKYKKTQKVIKINGVKCRVYKEKTFTKINLKKSNGQSLKMNTKSCYTLNTPKAVVNSLKNARKFYEEFIGEKGAKKYQDAIFAGITASMHFNLENAPKGLRLYSKSIQVMDNMNRAQMPPGFGPVKVIHSMKVSNLSEKVFDQKLFNIPKGYKKVKQLN